MKKNYFNGFCVILLMLSVLTTYAQTNLQKEQITSRYNKQVIQDLSKNFNEQAKVEKANATRLALLNGWPLIIKTEDSYMELQKISSEGKMISFNPNSSVEEISFSFKKTVSLNFTKSPTFGDSPFLSIKFCSCRSCLLRL